MEHHCASGTGATTSSQSGSGFRGSTEEQSLHVHPQEDLSSYPPCLDSTLQHIVRQLDILTQVSYQLTSKQTSSATSQKKFNC